jgi:hypothetical protein
VLTVRGLEIRMPADVDQTALRIKDAVGRTGVLGEEAPKRSGVAALRGGMLYVPLIEGIVQCVDGNWMFQCSTPLTDDERRTGAVPVPPFIFDFNKKVKGAVGCSRD